MTSTCNVRTFGDDDKYAKFACASKKTPGPLQKYQETLDIFNQELFKNSSFTLACGYVLLVLGYVLFGGAGLPMTEKLLRVAAMSIEILGLLVLRHKIQSRSSVKGV